MNHYEQYKRLIRLFAAGVIVTMEVAVYMFFWYELISPLAGVWYWRKGNWVLASLYIVLILFFSGMYGGFRLGYLERGNVIYSQILSVIIVNVITYIQIALLAYHFPQVWIFLLMSLCDIVIIVLWTFGYDTLYRNLFPARKLLLIYQEANFNSKEIIRKFKRRKDRYIVDKVIKVNDNIDEILSELERYEGVILCDLSTLDRNQILKVCFDSSVRVYLTPQISDILIRSAEEMHIFDMPILLTRNNGLTFEQQLGKRCLDIGAASIMIILTSPIMLLTAIAVKLYDRGNIVYSQNRLTIHGKEFSVYKFRSMCVDAESDGKARLAMVDDKRITAIGKVIRMLRIDELPQLFNVLKGDMSLVGPRPERPEIAMEYQKQIPQFNGRLKVKAGLTGYAQIYGKYNTTPYDKLKLDLTYIQNYSMLLDLKLLLLTVKILFMKESTEGIPKSSKKGE